MTSNRGNQHDQISAQFLQACYQAGDFTLAAKVNASLKKDLTQQMRYYKSFGDESMSDEQLGNTAYMMLQGKGGSLPDKQVQFAQDIFTSFRMLLQISEWEKQYLPGSSGPGLEKSTPLINNAVPPAPSDSKKKK